MTEEEKMKFWGELVEPILALIGGLLMRGEDKLLMAFRDIVTKAETAVLEEREACAKVADAQIFNSQYLASNPPQSAAAWSIAKAIRARGQG